MASSATRKRDLRSGKPVWRRFRTPPVHGEALLRDIRCDVAVIGAGISGAMIAEMLSDHGFAVAILDRRGPLKGSTAASTALLQHEIDEPLSVLEKRIGQEDAARAWRRSKLALESLAARIRMLDIRCHMARRPSLYLAGDRLGPHGLRDEMQARRRIGLESQFLKHEGLRERFGITRPAALLSFDNIAADPRQLTAGFLKAALSRGARLFAPSEVTNVESHRDEVTVATREGPIVRARTAIFATGYEMPKLVECRGHSIISTWAIATRRQASRLWPEQALIWEASDPYLYVRSTHDGRVICGGEDEEFSDEAARDALLKKKTDAISRKLGRLLPDIDPTPLDRWTGSFGASETGLPSIGSVPGHRNVYAVLGYGGNGITYSRIAAELLLSEMMEKVDPEKDLFAFR